MTALKLCRQKCTQVEIFLQTFDVLMPQHTTELSLTGKFIAEFNIIGVEITQLAQSVLALQLKMFSLRVSFP